ncbi:MAG: DUF4292 domain-containing protein [Saprospiraceae bacterium]
MSPNWLAFEATIDFRTPDQQLSVEGTIRVQRDQMLWASLRKFGFEVARIKADAAGIVVINRIESTYEQIPWASLKQKIGYPLDFAMAQTLLLGNIPAKDQAIWTKNCDSLRCTWNANNGGIDYQVMSQKSNLQPYQLEMVSREAEASLLALFDGIISFERGATSSNRQYQFKKKETGSLQLSIKMDGFEIDQIQKMPFAIPTSYQRVD